MHWDELLELGECWVALEETVRILEIMTLYTVPLSKILTLKIIKSIVLLFITFIMYCFNRLGHLVLLIRAKKSSIVFVLLWNIIVLFLHLFCGMALS